MYDKEFKQGLDKILKIILNIKNENILLQIELWAYQALKFLCIKYSKNFDDYKILIDETINFKFQKLQKKDLYDVQISQKEMFF